MSVQYFVVHDGTGRILRAGACEEIDVSRQAMDPGESVLTADVWVDQASSYVLGGALAPRPACPITALVAGRTITVSGVPLGCVVHVVGMVKADIINDAADGVVAITVPVGGFYEVYADPFPALPYAARFIIA